MKKKPNRILQIYNVMFIILAVFLSGFLSCGIDEYYYLPQVPEGNINTISNTDATIVLPRIDNNYATNYSIFYRIYISKEGLSTGINTADLRSHISSALASDFNAFSYVTDPTSTSLPSGNTFSNRDYFELEFFGVDINDVLSSNSRRTIRIQFPTTTKEIPYIVLNDGPPIYLRRSSNLISPKPGKDEDPYFRNTSDLSNYDYSIMDDVNKDVSGQRNISEHAYVSMYIVAKGIDDKFSNIYSKPTHISIFKLPNM